MLFIFRGNTKEKLSGLTLGEYEAGTVLGLCCKYKVSPVTLQRYAIDTFHISRKRIPRKILERYQETNWSLNDTEIAVLQVMKKAGIKDPKLLDSRAVKHTRERVRQVRLLLQKPRSPNYNKRTSRK